MPIEYNSCVYTPNFTFLIFIIFITLILVLDLSVHYVILVTPLCFILLLVVCMILILRGWSGQVVDMETLCFG